MKPSIPEIGTIIKVSNGTATVILNAGESCKKFSAGGLGICKPSGNVSIITVRVTEGINPGDLVMVSLDGTAKSKGLFLAFVMPLLSVFVGTFFGYLINMKTSIPYLEVFFRFSFLHNYVFLYAKDVKDNGFFS